MKTTLRKITGASPLAVWLALSCLQSSIAEPGQGTPASKPAKTAEAIPWSQIGAKAGADYKGDGLAVIPTADGARLRCVFQRLEGEATCEGLWLTSAVGNQPNARIRVVASQVGRVTPCAPGFARETDGAHGVTRPTIALPATGDIAVDGNRVRFLRPGLVEEYSVSMDGLRQDFVVTEKPEGAGELQVRLDVAGARVEQAAYGAQLALENSGRKIAYSRLRVTDATGRELPARMEVASEGARHLCRFDVEETVWPGNFLET